MISNDVPIRTVKVASSGDVRDIIQIDDDRFVCGSDNAKCLAVCVLPSCRVLHRTNLPGPVKGICVFAECSYEAGVLPNDALMRGNEELRLVVEAKEREVEEARYVAEELRRALRENQVESRSALEEKVQEETELRLVLEAKEREVEEARSVAEELRRTLHENQIESRNALEEKHRECEEFQRTLLEKEMDFGRVLSEKDEALQRKVADILELRASKEILRDELQADGLSTRAREFLRHLDSQRVSTLDLSERYRLRGCIDFRELILSSSNFPLARQTGDGRFAFRDIWFGASDLVPFEEGEAIETIVIDLFNDPSLVELLFDDHDVSRDDILDLQEDWDEFFRTEAVYDTAKLLEACEHTTRQKVDVVVSRIFDFFGGEVTGEVGSRYDAFCGSRVGSESFLGSLKGFGLGRHRSLCFKVACDRLGIPCRLIRGWRACSVDGLTVYEKRFADAWCIVNLCDRPFFVDLVSTGCVLDKFHPVFCEGRRPGSAAVTPPIDLVQFGSEYPRLPREPMGHGGFGQVFEIEFDEECYAVKETNMTDRIAKEGPVANARIRRELNLMSSFSHPNIVPTFGSFQFVRRSLRSRRRRQRSSGGTKITAIVMPLYDRNASVLREILREADSLIALRETLFLLLSVANGLRYLHSLSILHLDMKPDNVLVNLNEEEFTLSEIRICDFGGSRPHCTLMSLSALPVSVGFCSPEVKQAAEGDKTIVLDESSDVFSFGALMRFYNCYFGTFRHLYELCDRCLSVDCRLRPNLIEVMSILRSHLLFVDAKCRNDEGREDA